MVPLCVCQINYEAKRKMVLSKMYYRQKEKVVQCLKYLKCYKTVSIMFTVNTCMYKFIDFNFSVKLQSTFCDIIIHFLYIFSLFFLRFILNDLDRQYY